MARELARLTGESITIAARRAVEERLTKDRARQTTVDIAAELEALSERGRNFGQTDISSAL